MMEHMEKGLVLPRINMTLATWKNMEGDSPSHLEDSSMLEDKYLMEIEGLELMEKEDAYKRNDKKFIP